MVERKRRFLSKLECDIVITKIEMYIEALEKRIKRIPQPFSDLDKGIKAHLLGVMGRSLEGSN